MFEAFRASRRDLRTRKPSEQPDQPAPAPEPAAAETGPTSEPAPAEPQRRTVPDWHRGVVESDDVHVFPLGARANVVFALSYNALILAIVVFVVFAVLMGFVGYTIGTRPAAPVAPEPSGPVGVESGQGEGDGSGGGTVQAGAPYWCVQLLTIDDKPARKEALRENIRVLNEQHVPDLDLRRVTAAKQIILYAGKFGTRADAEALATRVKRIVVRGQLEFKGAMVTTRRKP